MKIPEKDIEAAVDYLRDNARKAGRVRAQRIYMDEFRKTVKAQIMREEPGVSIGAQESRAYADPRYAQHLEAMRTAIEEDEYHRWMMVAAQARIECWRTEQANLRAEGKAYG